MLAKAIKNVSVVTNKSVIFDGWCVFVISIPFVARFSIGQLNWFVSRRNGYEINESVSSASAYLRLTMVFNQMYFCALLK
tara:strand:- start:7557 stop:7796 length:240 start_codon:yes stop_codon:yes gene_type:complete